MRIRKFNLKLYFVFLISTHVWLNFLKNLLRFFRIPLNNKELNLDWVKVLKRCNVQTISKNTTICSNHFRPEDVQHKVVGTKVLAFLKNKDPPTLNLNIRDKSNNDLNQNDESDEEISDDQSSELINYNIFNTSDMDCQEYSQVTNHEK